MFMIVGAVVKAVESCSDERITYERRSDALQVLRVAKELAEETGIPLAVIVPRLKPFLELGDVVTPSMIGLYRAEPADCTGK